MMIRPTLAAFRRAARRHRTAVRLAALAALPGVVALFVLTSAAVAPQWAAAAAIAALCVFFEAALLA